MSIVINLDCVSYFDIVKIGDLLQDEILTVDGAYLHGSSKNYKNELATLFDLHGATQYFGGGVNYYTMYSETSAVVEALKMRFPSLRVTFFVTENCDEERGRFYRIYCMWR